MMKKNVLILLMFSFLLYNSMAQSKNGKNKTEDEDVIVVSGSRIEDETASQKTTQQVKVISSEDIQKAGSKTVSEVLRTVPEVTVNAQSSANPTETISMQGLSSEYVKVLIDGIAAGTDIDGSTSVFNLPVENIDHIEVISGAGSVMYGSNAMGGVVNIVTKKSQNEYGGMKIHFNIGDEASYSPSSENWRNYTAGGLSLAGENLIGNINASYDYEPGKERKTWDPLAGKINYYESTKKTLAFARGNIAWNDDWGRIGAYGQYNSSYQICNFTKTGYDKGSTMDYDTQSLEGGLNGKYIFDSNLSFTAFSSIKSYSLDTTYEVKAGKYSSSRTTDSDSMNWENELRANWNIGSFNEAVLGLNVAFDTIDGNSFDEKKSESQFAVFAQDTVKIMDGKLHIVPGARFTMSPGKDGEDTLMQAVPNIGLKYSPDSDTVFKLSYGMGYKIPSLRQKYWIFRHNYAPGAGNFILYGNPDLKAEKSHGFNFSAERNVVNLVKVNASAYFNYIKDLIDSVVIDASSSPQIREYQNIDKAMTYGASVSAAAELDRLELKAGYAYTAAKSYNDDEDEWQDMGLRSAHRITLSAGYMVPVAETKVSLNGEWNSPQLISSGGDTKTPDYLMVGLRLSKKLFDEKLEVYARADNLLDNLSFRDGTNGENQKSYYGLNDGRTFTLGAMLKM